MPLENAVNRSTLDFANGGNTSFVGPANDLGADETLHVDPGADNRGTVWDADDGTIIDDFDGNTRFVGRVGDLGVDSQAADPGAGTRGAALNTGDSSVADNQDFEFELDLAGTGFSKGYNSSYFTGGLSSGNLLGTASSSLALERHELVRIYTQVCPLNRSMHFLIFFATQSDTVGLVIDSDGDLSRGRLLPIKVSVRFLKGLYTNPHFTKLFCR